MSRSIRKTSVLIVCVLLVSCATSTLTPEDCALGAWYAVGHDDGMQGKESDLLVRHKKACSKHGIGIDTAEYRRGYWEGNKTYCDSYNHYGAGVVGESHVTVCSGEPYRTQHRQGIETYCKNLDHYARGESGGSFDSRCPEYPYRQQYSDGLVLYCANTNPFELGRRSKPHTSVCGHDFSRAYSLGRSSVRLEREIELNDRERNKQIRRLIDEKDTEKAEALRKSIQHLKLDLRAQHKDLLELKLEVKDLGYLDSDDLLGDLIELAL